MSTSWENFGDVKVQVHVGYVAQISPIPDSTHTEGVIGETEC